MFTGDDKILAAELVDTIRFFEQKNWTPALEKALASHKFTDKDH